MITYKILLEILSTKFGLHYHPDELNKIHKSLHDSPGLSDHEENALYSYTDHGYDYINRRLRARKDNSEWVHDETPHLDSAIAKHTTKHNTHVYRIIDTEDPSILGNRKKGEIYHDKGFVSTSIDGGNTVVSPGSRDAAKQFHVAKIKVPKGSKALSLPHYGASEHPKEHEVLLPRDSKFKYSHSETHYDGSVVHHLTHLPEGSK